MYNILFSARNNIKLFHIIIGHKLYSYLLKINRYTIIYVEGIHFFKIVLYVEKLGFSQRAA